MDGRIHTPPCEECRREGICRKHRALLRTSPEWDSRLVENWDRYSFKVREQHGRR